MTYCQPIDTHGRPIILVGMMGSGKTTVGKELSKLTGMPLLDMDAVIEEQIGKSIPDIFRDEGEGRFRALETALLQYLENFVSSGKGATIISTGGGVVLREINRTILKRMGYVVWFDVTVEALIERTSRANNRPLLSCDNKHEILERLQNERRALYSEVCHQYVETSNLDVISVVHVVHEGAKRYFSEQITETES